MVKTLATLGASVEEATALTCSPFLVQNAGKSPLPALNQS